MKKTIFLLAVLTAAISFSQEEDYYSVYFKTSKINGLKEAKSVAANLYGQYGLNATGEEDLRSAAGNQITVDELGIYIEKNRIHTISKEEVREKGQYTVRDGYLFGIVEGDSLPTTQVDEKYLFLLPVKAYLFDALSPDDKIYQVEEGEYVVLSLEEGDVYSALYIRFNKGLELMELSLEGDGFDLRKVKNQVKLAGELPTYIIDPDEKEWQEIFSLFETYDTYTQLK